MEAIISSVLTAILASLGTYLAIRKVENDKATDEVQRHCDTRAAICWREGTHLTNYLMAREREEDWRSWRARYEHCWGKFRTAIDELENLLAAAPPAIRDRWGWLPTSFHQIIPHPSQLEERLLGDPIELECTMTVVGQIAKVLPGVLDHPLPGPIQDVQERYHNALQQATVNQHNKRVQDFLASVGNRKQLARLLVEVGRTEQADSYLDSLLHAVSEADQNDLLPLAIAVFDNVNQIPHGDSIFNRYFKIVSQAYARVDQADQTQWVQQLATQTAGTAGLVELLSQPEALTLSDEGIAAIQDRLTDEIRRWQNAWGHLAQEAQAPRLLNWWNEHDSIAATTWFAACLTGSGSQAHSILIRFLLQDSSGEHATGFDLRSATKLASRQSISTAVESLSLGGLAHEAQPLIQAFRRTVRSLEAHEPRGLDLDPLAISPPE